MRKLIVKKSRPAGSTALLTVQKHFPGVTLVEDATEPFTAHVTEKISHSATARSSTDCAVAVACKREAPNCTGALIGSRSAYIIKGKLAIRYMVTESIRREITAFDRNGGFMSGGYRLLPPDQSRRLGTHITGKTHNPSNRRRPNLEPKYNAGIRDPLNWG